MGLSASQSRFLQLTARRNDNEYQAQQINHARTAVAKKMQDLSTKYNNGVNNRQLMFSTPVGDGSNSVNTVKLTYDTITAAYPEGLGYKLVTKNGVEIRPSEKEVNRMLEEAQKELDRAKSTKILNYQSYDETSKNTITTAVTGSNFLSLLQDYAITGNNGAVNKFVMAKETNGMDAAEFGQYWKENGLSLIKFQNEDNNDKVIQEVDQDRIAKAEAQLKIAMDRAAAAETTGCHYDDRCMDSEYLQEQLRSGAWTLQKEDYTKLDENGNPRKIDINYGNEVNIKDVLNTEDDNAYITEYNMQMDYYQHKDKQLELGLQQLQTSHNALQTEIDSVKKVIEKNVEKSFKTFG